MSLFSGQHNEPWYVKLNPEGSHVPVLCLDDKVIVEPSEIIDHVNKIAEGAGKFLITIFTFLYLDTLTPYHTCSKL